MIEKMKTLFRNNSELIDLLGGKTKKRQRVYVTNSPDFEEIPRIILLKLYEEDEISADNDSDIAEIKLRVTLYSKDKDCRKIIKIIKKIINENFPNSAISELSPTYEEKYDVYGYILEIESLVESEE